MTRSKSPSSATAGSRTATAAPQPAPTAEDRDHLDNLVLGDLGIEEAGVLLTALLGSGERAKIEAVYTACCARAWRQVSQRRFGDEMRPWYQLYTYAADAMGDGGHADIGLRLEGVCDMILESVRYGTASRGAKRGAHEIKLLSVLDRAPERRMKRGALMEQLDLKHANMSRILNNLETEGVIERETEGREVIVALTALGRETSKSGGRKGARIAVEPIFSSGGKRAEAG